jgi:hypothetical protein
VKVASTSETSVSICQTTQLNILQGSHLYTCRCDNIKSPRQIVCYYGTISLLKFSVFWDVASCSHIEADRFSEVRTVSIIRATMEAERTSETSVNFNVTTRRYIPKDSKISYSQPWEPEISDNKFIDAFTKWRLRQLNTVDIFTSCFSGVRHLLVVFSLLRLQLQTFLPLRFSNQYFVRIFLIFHAWYIFYISLHSWYDHQYIFGEKAAHVMNLFIDISFSALVTGGES